MRREECLDIFQKLPEALHSFVNLVLVNQYVIAVDAIARFEPHYLVLRGREGGSTDEGRGFFIPYDAIAYIRLDRTVRVGELKRYYGETGYVDKASPTDADSGDTAPAQETPPATESAPAVAGPIASPGDPASIARENLLARIRATRTTIGGTTSRPANDKK